MSSLKKISITLSILTHGWLGRLFILSLWAVNIAIFLYTYHDLDSLGRVNSRAMVLNTGMLLFCSNIFLYLIVASNLPALINNQMVRVLPNYFKKLRVSLLVLLFVSFTPAAIMLPFANFVDWLALLTVLLLLAMLVMAMVFKTQYFVFFIILVFGPVNITNLFSDHIPIVRLLAYSFPVLLVLSYMLLGKLENLRGKTMAFSRFLSASSFSLAEGVVEQELAAPKSNNIFIRWLTRNNGSYAVDLLNGNRKLSNKELIAVACQGNTVIGKGTYIFWGAMVVLICLIASGFDESNRGYFIPMMIIFPSMMIGTGTMTMFQNLLNKKSYLSQISTFPIFAKEKSFAKDFLNFVIVEQLKLYMFIYFTVIAFAFIAQPLTWLIALNLILLGLTLCLINLALILSGLIRRVNHNSLTIWLMFITFVLFMVWMLVVVLEDVTLMDSDFFIGCFSLCFTVFAISLYRSYQQIPHWLA